MSRLRAFQFGKHYTFPSSTEQCNRGHRLEFEGLYAHMNFPQPGCEHGVDSWVLYQVLGQLRPTCWAVLLAKIHVLLEALQAEVVLARC